MFKKLLINFKLFYYDKQLEFEAFLHKLQGRKEYIGIEEAREVVMKEQVNEKLRKGITRLVNTIYNRDTKELNPVFKTGEADLIQVTEGYNKTTLEKFEEARITSKLLNNPTDTSGGLDAIVQHNVKNAPKYVLERQKRTLAKRRMEELKLGNTQSVMQLTNEIKQINEEIKNFK